MRLFAAVPLQNTACLCRQCISPNLLFNPQQDTIAKPVRLKQIFLPAKCQIKYRICINLRNKVQSQGDATFFRIDGQLQEC